MTTSEVGFVLSIVVPPTMYAIGFLAGRLTKKNCSHPWELVDKTEIPSFLEQLGLKMESKFRWSGYDIAEMSRRTVILALRCPKCGEAKIHRDGPV